MIMKYIFFSFLIQVTTTYNALSQVKDSITNQYYSNGQLSSRITYKNQYLIKYESFYPTGLKKNESNYNEEGNLFGSNFAWYDNGKMQSYNIIISQDTCFESGKSDQKIVVGAI